MGTNRDANNGKYFGPQYLARDLFGNLIITMLFFIIALVLIPSFKTSCTDFLTDFKKTGAISEFAISVAIALAFIAIGYITNGIYCTFVFFYERLSNYRCKTGYSKLYARCKDNIDKIYIALIPYDCKLYEYPNKEMRLGSKVDRILKYLEYRNPEGYIGVYRYYMFVSIMRQAFIYTLLVLAYILFHDQNLAPMIGLACFAAVIMLSLKRTVKSTVITEYDYILTTLYNDEYYNKVIHELDRQKDIGDIPETPITTESTRNSGDALGK